MGGVPTNVDQRFAPTAAAAQTGRGLLDATNAPIGQRTDQATLEAASPVAFPEVSSLGSLANMLAAQAGQGFLDPTNAPIGQRTNQATLEAASPVAFPGASSLGSLASTLAGQSAQNLGGQVSSTADSGLLSPDLLGAQPASGFAPPGTTPANIAPSGGFIAPFDANVPST